MKKCLLPLLCVALISGSLAYAGTEQVYLKMSLKTFDEDNGRNLENMHISVFENGKLVKTMLTARNGCIYYNFELDRIYEFKVEANGGYIQKSVVFDTRNIDLEHWKYKNRKQVNCTYDLQLKLFRKEHCENYDFLNQKPVIQFRYDTKTRDLKDEASSVQRKIKKERRKHCKQSIAEF